jgi:phage tail P2-like protein
MPDDLLPPNATPQERALSLATGRDIAVPVKELWSPQTCPAGILPWLAWALSVDEWDPAWPEQTQRNTIAASIEQHRRKGTIGALRQALQRLGYEVEIDEQTGAAYTFALRLKLNAGDSAGGAVAGDAFQRAVDIALKTKNVRSELSDTKFLGEGGEAPLYSGGVPIIGAEVEIGGAVDPLPLDGLETFLLGSFWTVRMQAAYTGPIARVRRLSDNAEMNYFSVAELQAFVGAAEWQFIGFFSQGGNGIYLRYEILDDSDLPLDHPIRNRGAFDVNGNPFLRPIFVAGSANNLACSFADIDVTSASMVMAARVDNDQGFPNGHALTFGFGGTGLSYGLGVNTNAGVYFFNAAKAGAAGVTTQIFIPNNNPRVFGGNASGATNTLNIGTATASGASTLTGNAKTMALYLDQFSGSTVTPARFYGVAAWNQELGLTALESVRSSIATRLNF